MSVIAEAAFRADLAADELLARSGPSRLVLVRCEVADEVWFARFRARGTRPGHVDHEFVERTIAAGGPDGRPYRLVLPGVPTVIVDTTDGCVPDVDEIAELVAADGRLA